MSILLPDEIYQQEDNDFIQSINPEMVLVINTQDFGGSQGQEATSGTPKLAMHDSQRYP